jgi:spore germination protein KC
LLLLVTGCWDRAELEDYAFVSVIGIDKGKKNSLNITYQITRPRKAEEQQSAKDSAETITVNVDALFLSRHLVNATVSRKLNFSEVKVLVLSKEIAKSKNVIELLESLVRDRQFRRDIFIITTKGSAEGFIKGNKAKLEKFLYKQYELLVQSGGDTALIPFIQLQDFVQLSKDNPFIAETILGSRVKSTNLEESKGTPDVTAGDLSSHSQNRIQVLGTAIYKRQKMVGELTGSETIISSMLQGKGGQFHHVFHDPKDKKMLFGVILRQQKPPQFQFNLTKTPYQIYAKVLLFAEIGGIQSTRNYVRTEEGISTMENQINKELKAETKKLVDISQKSMKTDVFHFFEPAKTRVWTNNEWLKKDWNNQYPQANINIDYDVHIERIGRELGDSKQRNDSQ